jgi:hypothetical protein
MAYSLNSALNLTIVPVSEIFETMAAVAGQGYKIHIEKVDDV